MQEQLSKREAWSLAQLSPGNPVTCINEDIGLSGSGLSNLDDPEISSFGGLADGDGVDPVVGGSQLIDELVDDVMAVVLVPGQSVTWAEWAGAGWLDGRGDGAETGNATNKTGPDKT